MNRLFHLISDYTLSYKTKLEESLNSLATSFSTYLTDRNETKFVVKDCSIFSHYLASFLLYAKAASHSSPNLEIAEDLISGLEELSQKATLLLENMKAKATLDEAVIEFNEEFKKYKRIVLIPLSF